MVEFALNSLINESTGFTSFELTYGAMLCIFHKIGITPYQGVRAFAKKSLTNLAIVHDSIIASQSFQTHYANRHHSVEDALKEGDLVFLSTKNLNLPKHCA
jgi:hypothetical protein